MEARKRWPTFATAKARPSPQWSLAMEARKSPHPSGAPFGGMGPAMEPGHGGQEERRPRAHIQLERVPAMEPGHGGQEEIQYRQPGPRPVATRNGAWPWRPGRDIDRGKPWLAVKVPAMEPGHGGQEEPARRRDGRTTQPPRNGAWPWRPGRAAGRSRVAAPRTPRNGAWPWRPGRVGRMRYPNVGLVVPAMEPGHGGQEEGSRRDALPCLSTPQWSLAMEARKSTRWSTSRRCVTVPQWSLAMEARKRRVLQLDTDRVDGPAMEPGHGGQEEQARPAVGAPASSARNGAWPWRPGRASRRPA